MLQIATGRLFARPANRKNNLKGILYTNAIFARTEATVNTAAGRLEQSSSYFTIKPNVIVYEFTEHIETPEHGGPGALVSSGVEPYLKDYAIVVSFALNCICTPDVDLARRLSNGQPGIVTMAPPTRFVKRFFDAEIWCSENELKFLEEFVNKLIGLPRGVFLGVMRSMRTYVNAMHRISDDVELAYALLVASVESLAQRYDGHEASWESYDQNKRMEIDKALADADIATASKVRDALLRIEHVSLGSRFRAFVIDHTGPSYFRRASEVDVLLAKSDLIEVLKNAYSSRSKYIHEIQRLPDMVAYTYSYNETILDMQRRHLTLQGLSNLMRNAIIEFVMKQSFVDSEIYDYSLERYGVIQAQLAPNYWIGSINDNLKYDGRRRLEGFLQELSSSYSNGTPITDIRPVLEVANGFLHNIKLKNSRPYLALIVLFNLHASKEHAFEVKPSIQSLIDRTFTKPSEESLIIYAVLSREANWTLTSHREALHAYFNQRSLRLSRLFEAAITLELADRYRQIGDLKSCRELVSKAIENHPGHENLLGLEDGLSIVTPIKWRETLLPLKSIDDLEGKGAAS